MPKGCLIFYIEWRFFGTCTPSAFFICAVNQRKKGEALGEWVRIGEWVNW